MGVLIAVLQALVVISSLVLGILVLVQKPTGGISGMFGGGLATNAASSSVATKNALRLTIFAAVIWTASLVLLALTQRLSA